MTEKPLTPSASLCDEVRRAIANGLLAGNDYAAIRRALEAEPPMGQGSPEHFQAGFDLGLVRAAAVCDGIRQANYGRDAAWGVAGACASQIRALRTEQPSPSHANIGAGGGDEWIPACGLADGGGARCGLVKDHPEAHYDTLTGHAWERVGEEKPRPAASPEALSSDGKIATGRRQEAIEQLCKMMGRAWQCIDPAAHEACDCVCLDNGMSYQNAGHALAFMEECISEGIARRERAEHTANPKLHNPDEPKLVADARAAASRMMLRLQYYTNQEGWPSVDDDAQSLADACDELERQMRFDPRMAEGKNEIEHPWGAFLRARARVLRWLRDEMKETPEKTCETMSMDPTQVRMILDHVDTSPGEYPPEPPTPHPSTEEKK